MARISDPAVVRRFRKVEARISAIEEALGLPLPPDPPDPPDPPVGDLGSVGMNLAGLADYSTQYPFLDALRLSRPWTAHLPGQWGGVPRAAVDAVSSPEGHLNAMPAGAGTVTLLALVEIPAAMTSAAGRWRLACDGAGTFRVNGAVSNVTQNPGEVLFDYTPSGHGIVAIDVTAIDRANPLRFRSLVHERDRARHEAGEVFNPAWLARISRLSPLRFMDWQLTNHSPLSEWSDRPVVSDYTWMRRGIPLEIMVRLCNEAGVEMWACIPHLAADDFTTRFLEYCRDNLRGRLLVEHSNEVWNGMFGQAQWAYRQAEALFPGDPEGWMKVHGVRTAHIGGIVDRVYAGQRSRAQVVAGQHYGWRGLEIAMLEAPGWVSPVRPYERCDAYAVTGYFGYSFANSRAAELDGWRRDFGDAEAITRCLDALEAEILGMAGGFAYHRAAADRYGLKLVMYEGGSHVLPARNDANLIAFLRQMHRDPRIGYLYSLLLETWKIAGGEESCLFVDINRVDQNGFFGTLEHIDDSTPRWDAVQEFLREEPRWWT